MEDVQQYKNYFYNEFKTLASLVVHTTGCEQSSPNFVHLPNIRTIYTLHYCIQGKGTFIMNGKKFIIQPKQLFLMYPNVKIYARAHAVTPWELCWCGFKGSDARLLCDAIGFSPNTPVIETEDPSTVHDMLMGIYNHRGNKPYQLIYMTSQLYALLAFLMEKSSNPVTIYGNFQYVQKAIEFIELHYTEKITVEDIATYVEISRTTLYRAFIDNHSISPLDYLTEYRIRVACNLLEKGNPSIKELSYAAGFNSPFYFSTVFKRLIGISPSDYKSRHKTSKERG